MTEEWLPVRIQRLEFLDPPELPAILPPPQPQAPAEEQCQLLFPSIAKSRSGVCPHGVWERPVFLVPLSAIPGRLLARSESLAAIGGVFGLPFPSLVHPRNVSSGAVRVTIIVTV